MHDFFFLPKIGRPSSTRLSLTLAALALVQALSIAAMLAPAGGEVSSIPHPHESTGPRPVFTSAAALEPLRADASLGNPDAMRRLAAQLLDNYDRSGDKDELYEAIQWIDRDWYSTEHGQAQLIARLYDHHCDGKVLRWHPLCNSGE